VNSAQSQEIEKLKRDIQTKSEMLKVVEDQHCNYVRRLRDEYSKLEQKQEKMIFRKDIEYEDLMARTIQFKDTIVDLQKNVKSLEDAVLVQKERIEQRDRDIGIKQQLYEQLHTNYMETQEQAMIMDQELKENFGKIVGLEEELSVKQKECYALKKKEERLKELQKEYDSLQTEMHRLSEKLKHETYQAVPQKTTEGTDEDDVMVEIKGGRMNRGVQVKIVRKKDAD